MKIEPLGDKVLVEPIEVDPKTPGGIFIPTVAKKKPQKGKVISVGKGKILENGECRKMQVKKGDTVLFMNCPCIEVEMGSKKCLLMDESSIAAIVKEK